MMRPQKFPIRQGRARERETPLVLKVMKQGRVQLTEMTMNSYLVMIVRLLLMILLMNSKKKRTRLKKKKK
ncbi:hypothetical protein F2Q68_00030443 [Brassica cretica]|uniref:Uncharacterized protein n=1 Tax=Brassica cretica TaxID=69181 RepID=A0A8S9GGH3_BRACR|nr:hypothetical protein F2Q68_00030443 [Brassica cretica]